MNLKFRSLYLFTILAFLAVLLTFRAGDGAEPNKKGSTFRGPVGLQLYSLRNQLKKDGVAALDYAKEQGIKEVEFGLIEPYGLTKEVLKEGLEKRGLVPIAGMAPYDMLLNKTDQVADNADFFGVKYVGVAWASHNSPLDEAQTLKIADAFNKIGRKLKDRGLQFYYHNHGFEFQPYQEGETLFDLLVRKTDPDLVKFEMDVLWTVFPGQDPVALLKKYPDRWILMHLKDLAPGVVGNLTGKGGGRIDVAVGSGQVNYPLVLKTAQEIGIKHYFIEDESARPLEQIRESLQFLSEVKIP